MDLTRCFGLLRAFSSTLPPSPAVDADVYEAQRQAEYEVERAARAMRRAGRAEQRRAARYESGR